MIQWIKLILCSILVWYLFLPPSWHLRLLNWYEDSMTYRIRVMHNVGFHTQNTDLFPHLSAVASCCIVVFDHCEYHIQDSGPHFDGWDCRWSNHIGQWSKYSCVDFFSTNGDEGGPHLGMQRSSKWTDLVNVNHRGVLGRLENYYLSLYVCSIPEVYFGLSNNPRIDIIPLHALCTSFYLSICWKFICVIIVSTITVSLPWCPKPYSGLTLLQFCFHQVWPTMYVIHEEEQQALIQFFPSCE